MLKTTTSLETRFKGIVEVLLLYPHQEFRAKDIAAKYMENPQTSDALTTATILNTMALLGYVTRSQDLRSKKPANLYCATLKIREFHGTSICPVVRAYEKK